MDIDEDDDMDIDADEEDKDDEIDVEVDEEAEEEHSAPAYPVVVALPATVPSAEETEPPDAPPPMPTSAPTSLPPLLLPSASHREDRPEVNLPPRKRLGIALGPSYKVGESSAAVAARPAGGLRANYGFDEIVETLQGAPVSTDTELGAHVRDFESMVEIYTMLDDEQSQRQLLASRVNTLFRDRRGHAHTRLLMETEARMSRDAWGKSMDTSDLARVEVMSLRTTVHAQMSEITELQSADRSRRRAISDLLETDRRRHTTERDDSTSGTGHHPAGVGDSFTGIGDDITKAGYCITGTAGTRWGSCIAIAARGGRAKERYWKIPICDDDVKDYTIAITPVLSTEEPVNSLIMENEHLDTISATESDEFIKSSVEILVPIPSESKGVPKYEVEYVVASPPNSEPVRSKVDEIVIPEVGRIEDGHAFNQRRYLRV
ncbi:hypothetical protein Tco_0990006 [Tanacetum coccineum]|uniref:Uncharacterized protein n=1 Tax=Tanacetum coccineum TaxID=301880 RepID=A0ABQ5EWP2_9ASTR